MTNTFTDFHIKEDNEYVFVEFDEEMEIDENSYDCCDDEELSILSQSPSCSVSVCTENMFVEETSLNETNTASVVSLEEEQGDMCTDVEEKLSEIDAMIESLRDDEDEAMENTIPSDEEDKKLQDILLFGTHERSQMIEETEKQSSDNDKSLNKVETSEEKSETNQSMSRLSNKKRRKKLKEQKKKAAAAIAAAALAKMRKDKSVSSKQVVPVSEQNKKKTPSSPERKMRKNTSSPKLSVACATTTLAAFREQQQGMKKATRKINYVALL